MSTPKFTKTHNLVAFLKKPKESNGFEEIIDFLNASSIQYALTVNPTIYTTCIEQFWTSAKAKTVNGERQIQALVDKKKVIIIETSIRNDLKLDDAEGTYCLPTATIFEELERMGYENLTQKLTFYKAYFSSQWKFLIHTILQCLSAKTTTWNEFSSTMASAIICLATNQKFNFSKYIFDNMVKHLEGGVKFLMYPRFVQVFLDNQVEGMSRHKGIYVIPSHTKKVFANIKRPIKGFSRRITPLFSTMMVQVSEDMGEDSAAPTDSHSTPIITQPSSSKPQKKKSRRKQRKDSGPTEPVTNEATNEAHVSTPSYDPPQSGEDRLQLIELMSLCTKLQKQVLDLEEAKTAQAKEIASSKGAQEDASKQGRKIADLDADAEVTLIDETQERYDEEMLFDVQDDLQVTNASATTTVDELTLSQTLIEIKAAKLKAVTTAATTITNDVASTRPKAKGIVFHDQEEQAYAFIPIVSSSQLPQAKDKGKGKMVEPEKPLKKKDQIALDEELTLRLYAEEQAELKKERVAQEEASRVTIIKELDNIQAMIEADEQLATRLQAEEQEQFSIKEKSRMLVEMIAERKKFFAAQRAAEQRSKPPTKTQIRNRMCVYLKNMEVVKSSERRTEGSSKRAGDELESDKSKKQKIDEHVEAEKDDDQEEAEMKRHIEIVKDDEVAIDAIPLATKPPMIVEYKIDKDGRMGYFKLIRADGSSKSIHQ
ncbi:hypothetical protein Tco_0493927 [Tanacetum coccineum]